MANKITMSNKEAFNHGIALGSTKGLGAFGNKKGNFNAMSGAAKGLVVFGIMVGLGLLILGKFQLAAGNDTAASTEIGNVSALFSDLTVWGGIVLVVMMAYIILKYLNVFGNE